MTRVKASLIHLAISATIAIATFVAMLAVWYPGPFFKAAGGGGLVLILLGVDVTMGPLLTLVVFKPAKKSLRFDLTVIALLQSAAFLYGVSVIFQARPVYVAFVADRFELVRAADIDPADMQAAKLDRFRSLPLTGPVVVAVDVPQGGDEKLKALELALGGKDVHLQPAYYRPYESQKQRVEQKAQPLARLKEFNRNAAGDIDRAVARTGRKADELGFLPLRARNRDLAVIVDKASGDIVDYWDFAPWPA